MAKKDTYLALLRRGIDENTADILSDAGLKIGEIKKLTQEQLEQNYGLKPEIAQGVVQRSNLVHAKRAVSGSLQRFSLRRRKWIALTSSGLSVSRRMLSRKLMRIENDVV